MLHTKFRGNRSSGSGEDFLRFLYPVWAWRQSWSCDLDAGNKFCSPYPRRLHIKFGFDWPSRLRGDV